MARPDAFQALQLKLLIAPAPQRFQEAWAAQKANLPLGAAVRDEVDRMLGILPIAALR